RWTKCGVYSTDSRGSTRPAVRLAGTGRPGRRAGLTNGREVAVETRAARAIGFLARVGGGPVARPAVGDEPLPGGITDLPAREARVVHQLDSDLKTVALHRATSLTCRRLQGHAIHVPVTRRAITAPR